MVGLNEARLTHEDLVWHGTEACFYCATCKVRKWPSREEKKEGCNCPGRVVQEGQSQGDILDHPSWDDSRAMVVPGSIYLVPGHDPKYPGTIILLRNQLLFIGYIM